MRTNFELKKLNTLKVFQALQRHKILTRKQLETFTELSWGSISTICNELIRKQFLVAEKQSPSIGRPLEKLMINPNRQLSLGIDINSVGLSFDVVDLSGTPIYSAFEKIANREKQSVLAQVKAKTSEILDLYPDNIISINLSMQGALDYQTGVSIRSNFFEGWTDVPLVQIFEDAFHLPTYLYHDPECLLTYHIMNDVRIKDMQSGIIIRLDDGIGMAQINNGLIFNTDNNAACELGHTIVVPDGIPCPCGKNGCLEVYSSLRGIRNRYQQQTQQPVDDVVALLNNPDCEANKIMHQASVYLGISISNLFTLYSPDFILLDGIAISRVDRFYNEIQEQTRRHGNEDCHLIRATYKQNAASIGASILTIYRNLEEILFYDSLHSI